MKSIGVLYVPFQVPELLEPHRNILCEMHKNFGTVVIALLVRRVTPTKQAPLDYATRERMVREYYSSSLNYVHVVPVVDTKYPENKVTALESAVKSLFSEPATFVLYTSDEFSKLYKENGGKWRIPTDKTTDTFAHAVLGCEEESRANIPNKTPIADAAFRRGLIYGIRSQFPINWPTVDMAIRWEKDGKVRYLFGKKPGERNWRFAGGFKDREDSNFEAAVWREAGEEVLKKGVEPHKVFDMPRYITSRNVGDWRYKGEADGITTVFYQVNFHGTEDQIKAGDDLCDAAWLTLAEIRQQGIEGEHIYLLDSLEGFETINAVNVEPEYCRKCNTVLTCDCGIPDYKNVYRKK